MLTKDFLNILYDQINMDDSDIIAIIAIILSLISLIVTWKISSKQNILSETSIKMSKQPLFILDIKDSFMTEVYTDYGRRQLHIHYSLKNIGDAPALSVYCCGYFELQQTTTKDNSKIVPMDFYPEYFHAIEINKEENFSLRFENKEIDYLVGDLNKEYEMNMNRVKTNPSKEPYEGPILVTEIFFLNTVGQWFRYTHRIGIHLIQEVNREFLKLQSTKPKQDCYGEIFTKEYYDYMIRYNDLTQKLDNVPPNVLKKESNYQLHFVNPHYYNSFMTTLDQKSIRAELSKYDMSKEMTITINLDN